MALFRKKDPTIEKIIGSNLQKIRRGKGMTQVKLGSMLGVTQQQIQRYESGRNSLSARNIYRCSRIFGRPTTVFFEED